MHLLYCDESNMEPRTGDFLIYAGVMISSDAVASLHAVIEKVRADFSISRDHQLKFNPGPSDLSHREFIELKKAVIAAAVDHGVKVIVYVVLHDIAESPDIARRNGINTICYHFDCLLNRRQDVGLVLIDRFNDDGNKIEAHLREKFSIGLKDMPFSKEMPLRRIVGFHYSAIGQAHMASIADIVIGSLRFAINTHTRQTKDQQKSASEILSQLGPLFWRREEASPISELSLIFSPKGAIRVPKFRESYLSLREYLCSHGIDSEQEIN